MMLVLLLTSAVDVSMSRSVMHDAHSSSDPCHGHTNFMISHECAACVLYILCIPDDADVMLQGVQWHYVM